MKGIIFSALVVFCSAAVFPQQSKDIYSGCNVDKTCLGSADGDDDPLSAESTCLETQVSVHYISSFMSIKSTTLRLLKTGLSVCDNMGGEWDQCQL